MIKILRNSLYLLLIHSLIFHAISSTLDTINSSQSIRDGETLVSSGGIFELIGHAWTLYKEDSLRELVDASLGDSFDISEALRSIHVGLLCVQARPEDRPSMSSVVFMLSNKVELPEAKCPAFFTQRDVYAAESYTGKNTACSANQVSITVLLDGR